MTSKEDKAPEGEHLKQTTSSFRWFISLLPWRVWAIVSVASGVFAGWLWFNGEVRHPDPYQFKSPSFFERLTKYPIELKSGVYDGPHIPTSVDGETFIGREALLLQGQCDLDAISIDPASVRPDPEGRRVFALNDMGQPIVTSDGCQNWTNLSKAVSQRAPFLGIDGHSDNINSVAWSPDGRFLATGSSDHTPRIWNAETGETLHTLIGHTDRVLPVAWSPDGRFLATGSDDTTARIWNAKTGETLHTLTGHTGRVLSVAWSPDGRFLATGSRDTTARIWNAETGETLYFLTGHTNDVNSVAWSPDGRFLATGSEDNTARIWTAETGETLHNLTGHTFYVTSVAWNPDGRFLATGSDDNTARIWTAETGESLHSLIGHTRDVNSIAWSPDGRFLATGAWDDTARIWNAETGEGLHSLTGHTSGVLSVAWSPDGRFLATGSWDDTARIWNAETGETLHSLTGHTRDVNSVEWSPDGRFLATGSYDNTARIWNAETGEGLQKLTGHVDFVLSVAWSPDGRFLATGSGDGTARIWNAETGEGLHSLTGHTSTVNSVEWSPDGRFLATGSWDNTARIWNAETGEGLHSLTGHINDVYSVAWSPDGHFLATGSGDHTARIWNAETGETLHSLTGHTNYVLSVAWSPDGRFLAMGSDDNTARIWNAETGESLHSLTGHTRSVHSVAWSPDGHFLATGSEDNTARIWNAETGESLHDLTGHTRPVLSVVWSPNGHFLATGSRDTTARIWNTETGESLHNLGHTRGGLPVAWSPDGRFLATGSRDGTTRIWNAETGEGLHSLTGHTSRVLSVAWNPDGRFLATGSWDNTTRIWNVETGAPVGSERWRLSSVGEISRFMRLSFIEAAQFASGRDRLLINDGYHIHQFGFDDALLPYQSITPPNLDVKIKEKQPTLETALWWPDREGYVVLGTDGRLYGGRRIPSGKEDFNTYKGDWALLAMPEGLEGELFLRSVDDALILSDEAANIYLAVDWPETADGWNRIEADGLSEIGSVIGMETASLEDHRTVSLAVRSDDGTISHYALDTPNDRSPATLKQIPKPSAKGRAPAVWIWSVLLLLGAVVCFWVSVETFRLRGRKSSGIEETDEPLEHFQRDRLGAKHLAWQLTRIIKNPDTKPPMTIVLSGAWGSGKSSVMNLCRTYLQHYGQHVAWVDPWHQRSDADMLNALAVAINTTLPPFWRWQGLVLGFLIFWSRTQTLLAGIAILISVFILLSWLLPAAGLWDENISNNYSWFLSAFDHFESALLWIGAPLLALLAPSLLSVFTTHQSGFARAISGLLRLMSFRLRDDPASLYQQFGREYAVCANSLNRAGSGLVVVIDDLDRCQAERIVEVFELINMLALCGPAIVIMGIDEDKVLKAIATQRHSYIGDKSKDRLKEARNYLEKFINIKVDVQTHFQDRKHAETQEEWEKAQKTFGLWAVFDRCVSYASHSILPLFLTAGLFLSFHALEPAKNWPTLFTQETATDSQASATHTQLAQKITADDQIPVESPDETQPKTLEEGLRKELNSDQPSNSEVKFRKPQAITLPPVPNAGERHEGYNPMLDLIISIAVVFVCVGIFLSYIVLLARSRRAEAEGFDDRENFRDIVKELEGEAKNPMTPRDYVRYRMHLRAAHLLNAGSKAPTLLFQSTLVRFLWLKNRPPNSPNNENVDRSLLENASGTFLSNLNQRT